MTLTQLNTREPERFVATRNACKVCSPLGASIVFRGIEGAIPILHGSQGCATYIRRYVISHFKEPIDVASSNFSETSAIFGGEENLRRATANVIRQYEPQLIGIATTCLSETIGDDVPMLLRQVQSSMSAAPAMPALVHVSTPSYSGTHMDGFHAAVHAVASAFAQPGAPGNHVNVLPGFVSPADLRHLKELLADFGLPAVILPDYSDTLDGPAWDQYQKIPAGGTPLASLRTMGQARATLQFGRTLRPQHNTAAMLQQRYGVLAFEMSLPIGVRQTDALFTALEQISGRPVPEHHQRERGRLIDSYVDGHKYVFGKRAIVYGEEDLVAGLVAALTEIGVVPVLCATGGESGRLAQAIDAVAPGLSTQIQIRQGMDFAEMGELARDLKPDLLVGSSKGYSIARELDVPLVRVGFPVHDRIGAQRTLHLSYRGAQQLFDRIANALLEHKQSHSPVGYSYM